MLAKYYQYNHLSPALKQFMSRMNELIYSRYASDLLNNLLRSPEFDMDNSVKKTIAVFRITGIPVQEHICCVYRSDSRGIRKDWRLSELACSLIILTSDSTSNKIREVQNELLDFYGL
jgi:hypothetical protein